MGKERTLSIIKPDAVEKNNIGEILSRFEKAGLRIAAAKMLQLTKREAEAFYAVHRERPFFGDLTGFMCSGPILVLVLEGDNAVMKNREIMGATDPKKAAPGTVRADLAASIDENAVHGSDSLENAEVEIDFFFGEDEICHPRNTVKEPKKGGCGDHSCGCH
jgi:nucleoside-diphosphate kinase